MKTTSVSFLFSILLLISSCSGNDGHKRVLKLAHGLPTSHSVHLGMVYMGHCLDSLSGGKMGIDIYPSGQLGSETQCIELLQIGSLDVTKVSSGAVEGFIDEYKIFGIPYLFRSKAHYFAVLDGPIGEEFLHMTEPYRFIGLGYYDSGARSFYTTNRAINHPDDLRGLKIRVMRSPIAVEMMRAFGGSATPVDWGELYTALQSSVVDGAENNTPSVTTAFHHEVAKYYTVDEHTMLPDVMIMSTNMWRQLTEQERAWVKEAMRLSVAYQRDLWAKQEVESMNEMKEKGMQIIYPDKTPFQQMSAPLLEKFRADSKYTRLIEEIEAVQEPVVVDTVTIDSL